jgi:hypothetical protein
MPEIVGEIDRGHAAAPEFTLDCVAVSQGFSQRQWCDDHRMPKEREYLKSVSLWKQ